MPKILIFAGTTEGRKLSELLAASEIVHTLCVATEYGEIVLKAHPLVTVHRGRMDQQEIRNFVREGGFGAVVDATHPYAEVITANIRGALQGLDIPCLRLRRETGAGPQGGEICCFADSGDCAKALEETEGNILLTTGSKELACFCASQAVKERLYVRVLPGLESLKLCMEQGIGGKHILALQGPFTTQLNEAILRQYQIGVLVTKASGRAGGYEEKLEAARRTGTLVYVIGHAQTDEGLTFAEVCRRLEALCGRRLLRPVPLEILLAGMGMGSRNGMTREVLRAVENADILLGAERLLADFQPRREKKPFYRAREIIPYLQKLQAEDFALETGRVVILFSGDSGFYSGCKSLYEALRREVEAGTLTATLRILPGISSVAYLAACIGESYQDGAVCSMHGRKLPNLVRRLQREKKTFLLMSGAEDMRRLGELLLEAGMTDCEILAGYQLSYPQQQIWRLTPGECCEIREEGLYTCCIRNPHAAARKLTHGMADGGFIRDRVPMTKEEVREVSICKLRLHQGAVVYDIGSGTGSVAAEIAALSEDIQVYAIEKKDEAVALIEKNKEKLFLENLSVIAAQAPEGLEELPVPTHAFIGGSGGRLKEILSALQRRNPHMRIVINAVTLETVGELREVLEEYPVENEEMVQMQVSRVRKAGSYHLQQAENPVWICAFDFSDKEDREP
ncbi:MAG: precorrin-6A reductase [Lachnospiraceae bacterium]|nr:precorrin-6A reductase [Lachnospiraceae bacterium]